MTNLFPENQIEITKNYLRLLEEIEIQPVDGISLQEIVQSIRTEIQACGEKRSITKNRERNISILNKNYGLEASTRISQKEISEILEINDGRVNKILKLFRKWLKINLPINYPDFFQEQEAPVVDLNSQRIENYQILLDSLGIESSQSISTLVPIINFVLARCDLFRGVNKKRNIEMFMLFFGLSQDQRLEHSEIAEKYKIDASNVSRNIVPLTQFLKTILLRDYQELFRLKNGKNTLIISQEQKSETENNLQLLSLLDELQSQRKDIVTLKSQLIDVNSQLQVAKVALERKNIESEKKNTIIIGSTEIQTQDQVGIKQLEQENLALKQMIEVLKTNRKNERGKGEKFTSQDLTQMNFESILERVLIEHISNPKVEIDDIQKMQIKELFLVEILKELLMQENGSFNQLLIEKMKYFIDEMAKTSQENMQLKKENAQLKQGK